MTVTYWSCDGSPMAYNIGITCATGEKVIQFPLTLNVST